MRPFADPAVGYVAAPSICDANAAESWAARARLYENLVAALSRHGILLLGRSERLIDPAAHGLRAIGPHAYERVSA